MSQLVLLGSTVFLLLATITICFIQADLRNITIPDDISFNELVTPSYSVIFGFLGFEAATAMYSIVREARTVIPRAITYSVIVTGVLYLAYVTSLIVAVPTQAYLHKPVLLTTLLTYVSPHTRVLNYTVHFALLSAIIGTIHATIWSSGVLLRSITPQLLTTGRLWENTGITIIGTAITLTYLCINDITFGMRITVIMRMIIYTLALVATIIIPQSWKTHHAYVALIGIIMATYIAGITAHNML